MSKKQTNENENSYSNVYILSAWRILYKANSLTIKEFMSRVPFVLERNFFF